MTVSTIQAAAESNYHIKQGTAAVQAPTVTGATADGAKSPDGPGAEPYNVDFSQQARYLMAEESQQGEGDASAIDVAIEQLKEQIKAVQEQLAKLENVEGEAAEAQKKMLAEMLGSLNSQLMELVAQKLEMMG